MQTSHISGSHIIALWEILIVYFSNEQMDQVITCRYPQALLQYSPLQILN